MAGNNVAVRYVEIATQTINNTNQMLTAQTTCTTARDGCNGAGVGQQQPPSTVTDDRINRTTPASNTADVVVVIADDAAVADSNHKRFTDATVASGYEAMPSTAFLTGANIPPNVTVSNTNRSNSSSSSSFDITANHNNGLVQTGTPVTMARDAESIVYTNAHVVASAPHSGQVRPENAPVTAAATTTTPATDMSGVVAGSGRL